MEVSQSILQRKGARTTGTVPPEIRALLDVGAMETVNLCEWLVVDQKRLSEVVFAELDLLDHLDGTWEALAMAKRRTALQDIMAIGGHLANALREKKKLDGATAALGGHRSDIVRSWGAFLVGRRADLQLAARLKRIRPFAADSNMGVREAAWLAVRPAITGELEPAIERLAAWAVDPDTNVRRFASEATRPRGVWCRHIERLKEAPELGLPILEPLRADPAKYVQDSVGNWLNDASKSQPRWTKSVCARWRRESPTKETERIVKRALRTINKTTH